jgi:hypothetical protein
MIGGGFFQITLQCPVVLLLNPKPNKKNTHAPKTEEGKEMTFGAWIANSLSQGWELNENELLLIQSS